MKKKIFASILSILILGSCHVKVSNSITLNDNDSVANTSSYNTSNEETRTTSYNSDTNLDFETINTNDEDKLQVCPSSKPLTYQDLFDLNNKVNVTIDVANMQLLKLREDLFKYEKSEIYRIADKVTVEVIRCSESYIYEFNEVGIRLKGNTSRTSPIDAQGNLITPSHYKLSFTEVFDDVTIYGSDVKTYSESELLERKERSLLGLEKLDLKWNRSYDSTHIKEIYSYKMYRDNGILAPYSSLASIKMNKDSKVYNLGVYMIYETVDKKFIKRHLEEKEYFNMKSWSAEKIGINGVANSKYGDLYKVSYGKGSGAGIPNMTLESFMDNRIGEETNDGTYIPVYDRKTNKGTDNNERLRNTLTILNNGNYDDIEKVVDLDYFARYEAISYLVGDPDDIRNNYNNYYLYIRRTDGKMIIIPYDHDRVFGVCCDWNPSGSGMKDVKMYSKMAVGSGKAQVNPLYLKTLLATGNNKVKQYYETYCKALKISKWFTSEKFNKSFTLAKTNYGNDYFTSSNGNLNRNQIEFSLTGYGNYSFEEYVNDKLKLVPLNEDESSINDLTLYLVGDFNDWTANESYRFKKQSDEEYTLTVKADSSFNNTIYFKINDGSWQGEIDWGFDEQYNIIEIGPNGSIQGVYQGDTIDFTINIKQMHLTYTIKGSSTSHEDKEYYFAYADNGWADVLNNNEFIFTKNDTDNYTYTFIANQNYELLKFKIMCSNGVLYGTDENQFSLINHENAQTFKVYNLIVNQKVNIYLNQKLQSITWQVI